MKKVVPAAILLLLFVRRGFSFSFDGNVRNDQFLINARSNLYDDIFLLFAEQKKTPLVVSRPATIGQFKSWLSEINYHSLSDSGKKIFDNIGNEIGKVTMGGHTGTLQFSFEGFLNPEFYTKTNENVDWVHDYFERPPFLDIPIYLSAMNFFATEIDFSFSQKYDVAAKHSNCKNMPYDFSKGINIVNAIYEDIDWTMPKIGYLSLGTQFGDSPSGINFFFGRSPLAIGNTKMRSIALSQAFEVDWIGKLQIYAPGIKYTVECEQVGTVKIRDESGKIVEKTNSYLYLHNFSARPFKWFQISWTEGVFVSAPFELKYFNPMMIMHQFSYWNLYNDDNYSRVCGYMAFNFEFTPIKNFRLYGIWAQTENQTSSEKESRYGKTVPQGYAAQVGINYKLDSPWFGDSYWNFNLEGVYTSPWVYIRQAQSGSLVKILDGAENLIGIGSPEGPDSIIAQLSVDYKATQLWEAGISYRLSIHGENYFDNKTIDNYPGYFESEKIPLEEIDDLVETASDWAPTGIAKTTNTVTLSGKYYFSPKFNLGGSTSFSFINNNKNKSGKNAFCFEMAITGQIKFF